MADPMQPLPEIVSPLQEAAIVMHETYMAFVYAGFSESQAMEILLHATNFAILEEDDDYDD